MSESPQRHAWISRITRAAVAIGALAIGALVFTYLFATRPQLEAVDQAEIAPKVQVMRAERMNIRRQWRGFGTAEAMDSADVPARVATAVEHVPDRIVAGATVAQGELLVRLDSSDFQQRMQSAASNVADLEAQLRQLETERKHTRALLAVAEEDVAIARSDFERIEELFKSGAGSPQDVDRAKRTLLNARRTLISNQQQFESIDDRAASLRARREAQQAAFEQAKLAVERCAITSPLAGVLEAVHVERGEHIANGQIVARVVSLKRIEIPVRVPTAARGNIAIGDTVELRATNESDHRWQANVARIAPSDDAQTRTVTIYAEMTQPPDGGDPLVPGRFVEAIVTASEAEARWIVPERALRSGRVSIVTDDAVTSRPVQVAFLLEQRFPETGLPDDQWAALRTPLTAGELVIVNPSQSMVDGKRVEPVLAGGGNTADADDAEPSG